jgi:hypothetical protein
MKRITYSVLVGSLALALTALAAPNDNSDRGKGKARKGKAVAAAPASRAPVKGHGSMSANGNISGARLTHRDVARSSARSNAAVNRERAITRSEVATRNRVQTRENVAVARERNFRANNEVRSRANVAVNRERDIRANRIQRAEINRTRNVTVVNNWRGERFSGPNYVVFRNYHRSWHDRDWWHHHHSHITFVLGGWWYWDAGYWYPAWGYDRYSYYPYDGPIYTGYATLAPDQVVVNVQAQLQREGYYPGPIDGDLGPMTRRAIAAFQADRGLAITSTIDRPTLSELGVS